MRVEFLGAPIDTLTLEETLRLVHDSIVSRRVTLQVSLNVAKLVKMRSDAVLREDVLSGDIISADGMGIVLGSRLLGIPVKQRVAGIDLMLGVLALCAREGFRPFFLGATADISKRAAAAAVELYPGLRMAGHQDGYFAPQEESDVVERIRASQADCLFVGMPTPRKERFLKRHRNSLDVPFIMGVGGSFDVLAGKTPRAPFWMQAGGLEWLYRTWQEPRRLWWRYFSTNVVFAGLLIGAMAGSVQKSVTRRGVGR